jgi:hypothetical protein
VDKLWISGLKLWITWRRAVDNLGISRGGLWIKIRIKRGVVDNSTFYPQVIHKLSTGGRSANAVPIGYPQSYPHIHRPYYYLLKEYFLFLDSSRAAAGKGE